MLRQLLILSLLTFAWPAYAGDLDDLDLLNPRQPQENLTVGGQPSQDDLTSLAEEGYGLVINLRTEGEFSDFNEGEVVESLGMKYINIPVQGSSGLTEENAALLHQALESVEGPVLLHCGSGKRAGSLLGVEGYLFHDLSEEEAVALGQKANLDDVEAYMEGFFEGNED